jgi:hypothetical protein
MPVDLESMKSIPVGFYRLGWQERTAKWTKEQKEKTLKEISDISLERPITEINPDVKIKLKSVPSESFTGLQLYAGMLELFNELHGSKMKMPDESDALVKALSKKKVKDVV